MRRRPGGPTPDDGGPIATPPRAIALVGLSAIGDVVHMLPVVNALRRAHPDARITWVIQPVPHRLVRGHPAVDEFIVFDRRRGVRGVRAFLDARRELRRRRFDLLIDLQVAFKAGVLTAFADADVKLGYDRRRARDLNWLFTTHRIPPRPGRRHVQDEYFEFLEHIGVDPEPVEWGLEPTAEERERQRAFFARFDRPVCAVVVGTTRPRKNWAPDRYARLLDAIEAELGFRTLLVGGPSAAERRIADRVLALTTIAAPVDALGDGVRRLLWLLDGSDLLVSPDTGPLHIAHAIDLPVVGLYGYTNPNRFGPYRKYRDLVVDGYARYAGERYGHEPVHRPEGMARITVDAALDKVRRAVDIYVRRGRRAASSADGRGGDG
ncbi:MAG: glycosyltransferase family 9 protein [Gemmatimonadota bacterium]